MKTLRQIALLVVIFVLFLPACQADNANTPVVDAPATEPAVVDAPESAAESPMEVGEFVPEAADAQPEPQAEPTPAPTEEAELPVFPNREKLTYFDILPDWDDIPDYYGHDFVRYYEAARYDGYYSLRVVYVGALYENNQWYLAATVTVADDPGFFNLDELAESYINTNEREFPQLGDGSGVLSGVRQYAYMLDGNRYLEVTILGGGDEIASPERAYEQMQALYESLPDELPAPADFALTFPEANYSQEAADFYLHWVSFENYTIHSDGYQRVGEDMYWDSVLYYRGKYTFREMMFGLFDTETGQYTYQRYKQGTYNDYWYDSRINIYTEYYTPFDLLPEPSYYQVRVWIEQDCVMDWPLEIHVVENE